MRPSLIVPHGRAKADERVALRRSAVVAVDAECVSSWKIALRPPPSFSEPRKPKRELLDSISLRVMIGVAALGGPAKVAVADPAGVAPLPFWRTISG
jgi:hypothetical protein